ncbi:hypothetical protein GCM10009588_29580 [Microbacterium phyllosphaerae]
MLRKMATGGALVLALVLASPVAAAGAASDCAGAVEKMGLCGSTNGSTLTVSGTQQQPGAKPKTNAPRGDGGPDTSTTPAGPSKRALELAACMDDAGTTRCAPQPGRPAPEATTPPTPGTPTITITDLARFTPAPVRAASEPGNVGIAGMPTNFVAGATTQIQSGVLFGIPLQVRFTPAGYDYTYGDGDTATVTRPGQTWAALDQAQFTPTPTSHVYEETGVYMAEVDVRYAAEIDLGGGWMHVDGQLTTDGPDQEIRIFEAHTALVAHTCLEKPTGVGC